MARPNLPEDVARGVLLASGTAEEIADLFGVSNTTVTRYKRLQTEYAIRVALRLREEGLYPETWEDGERRNRFTPEQVAVIRASSATSAKLAKAYGCSPSLIRMIRSGRAYG